MLIFLSAKAKAIKPKINQAILEELTSCDFAGMDLPELMAQLLNLQNRLDTINKKN